jgi:polyferredoxin
MSEEKLKKIRLVAYWLFSTTVVVFAAVTAYIALWTRPVGATMTTILKAGLPIWGITAVAAAVFFGGYYIYNRRQA